MTDANSESEQTTRQKFHDLWNEVSGTGLTFDEKMAKFATWHHQQLEAKVAEARADELSQLLALFKSNDPTAANAVTIGDILHRIVQLNLNEVGDFGD